MAYNINLSNQSIATGDSKPVSPVTMELEKHENVQFMSRFERYEPLVKDSTAIRTLKECPRKFFYQIVLGFIPNEKSVIFAWGSAYHLFREKLEVNYGFGDRPFEEKKSVDAFVLAAQAGLGYWKAHGQDQPVDSKWAYMTTNRLAATFKVAYEHWKLEKQRRRIIVLASEQAFNIQLADGSFTGGRADQLVRWNGKLWGRDFKTTSKDSDFYARQLEPSDQFTRYTLADSKLCGELVQGQLVELMYNAKPTKSDTKGPKVIELVTSRTEGQLKQFEKEQAVINRTLKIYREEDIWPMHEVSCPFCPYHSVCTKPTEAGQMAQLEQNYSVRPWDFNKVGTGED